MSQRIFSAVMFIMLLMSVLTGAFDIQPVGAQPKTWIVDDDGPADFQTIQEAINASSDGDTISIRPGAYYEKIVVNKSISLLGENKETTVIYGNGTQYALSIWAQHVSLAGFAVTNATAGIRIETNSCTINNVKVFGTYVGIWAYESAYCVISDSLIINQTIDHGESEDFGGWGIFLETCWLIDITNNTFEDIESAGFAIWKGAYVLVKNNTFNGTGIGINLEALSCTVVQNHIENNLLGIYLSSSSDNAISGNNIRNNNRGIWLDSSSNNTVSGNSITNNSQYGISLGGSSNNSIAENTITKNLNGILLDNSSGNSISENSVSNNSVGGIRLLVGCSSNSISGNNITGNEYGITIVGSSSNEVSRNSIVTSNYGIHLEGSLNNTICRNNVTIGFISIRPSDPRRLEVLNNTIFHNNFINTATISWGSVNIWDDGYPSGGNYWSDHNGTDANHDGIGDAPYVIDANNIDRYPLMVPYVIPRRYEIAAVYGSTPTVDGSISSGEWSDAASASFNNTEVFVKQDGMNLYIGFNNSETQFHDDDAINIFIDADHDGSLTLQSDDIGLGVYRNGTLLEANVTGGTWTITKVSGWTAMVNSSFDMWQAEFNITYSKINVVAGVEKNIGAVFVCYRGLEGSSPNMFSWPPGISPGPGGNPSMWGTITSAGHNWTSQHDVAVMNVSHKTVVGLGYCLNVSVTAANPGDYPEVFNVTSYYGNGTFLPEQWNVFWRMGDCSRDGYINEVDKEILDRNFGWSGSPGNNSADLNSDGTVDMLDAILLAGNFGKQIWKVFLSVIGTQTISSLANEDFAALTFVWNTTGIAYGNCTITAVAKPVVNETNTFDNNCTCSIPVHVGVPGDISGPTQGVYDGITNMRDISYLILLFTTKPSSPNWNPNADINNDATVNMRDISIAILNFNKHE